MSEPNYGQNGWALWRGEVTATLKDVCDTQREIKEMLKDRDDRISGRIGDVQKEIGEAHKRIDAVEQRWTWAALSALAALVMALAAWIAKFIRIGG